MTWVRALSLSFLVAFALTCTAGVAYADDEPAAKDESPRGAKQDRDYVAKLTKEELAAVKEMLAKRDMSWDALEPQTRNRLAFAVVRMRDMTEEERQRFRGKLERIRREELERKERMGKRLEGIRKDDARARKGAHFIRISHVFFERMLDAEQRRRFKQMGLPLLPFQIAVFERFKEHVGATALTEAEITALPDRVRAHLEKMRARLDEEQDPKKRERFERGIRRKAGHLRVEAFVRRLEKPTDRAARGAHAQMIVQKLQAQWPQAFDAARDDLAGAIEDPEKIRQILQANQKRGQKQQQLFGALMQLERTLPLLASDEPLHKKAKMLFDGILTRGFGVPKEAIEHYPVFLPRQDWRVRRGQVFAFLQRHGKLDDEFVSNMQRGLQRANDARNKLRDRPPRGPNGQNGKKRPARDGK